MPGVDGADTETRTLALEAASFGELIAALSRRGYRVIGPTIVDDAVVYSDILSAAQLPTGVGDEQAGGQYRLRTRADGALFGYTVAPQGWKRHLYPPRQKLFSASRQGGGFQLLPPDPPTAPMAFLGVRACELAAISIHARVFGNDVTGDPGYCARLASAFIVAVECGEAGSTCFCGSMGTGPQVRGDFDIRLVELTSEDRHVFLADAGSLKGAEVLAELDAVLAGERDRLLAQERVEALRMGRDMLAQAARRLGEHAEHARWDDVAKRCLSCGNCTMVCPTCFCTTVEDTTDLKGDQAERWRSWDSCFSVDFSYIHGGPIRRETRSRYRQWITHKLSAWHEQFGTSGCVGCGRCITWCPVGIDITEEVRAINAGGKER